MAFGVPAYSQTVEISGVTYAIGNGFTADSTHPEGSHFHSSNLGSLPAENPSIPLAGVAEVGGFFGDEEVRGLSEFSLVGQQVAQSAMLQFTLLDLVELGISPDALGGIFGQEAFDGMLEVYAYRGDNVEALTDYEVAASPDEPIAILDASQLTPGQLLEFDITELYNGYVGDLLADMNTGPHALGVRLQMAAPADPNAGALAFHDFKIIATVVPEPSGMVVLLAGLLPLVHAMRRRR
jgi:hypothetical protein